MAKKFTPIQAIGRPYNLPIEAGVTLERGIGLWFNSLGQVTNVAANAVADNAGDYTIVGFCDEVQTNPERYDVINETHQFTQTVSSSGVLNAATTVNLLYPNVDVTDFGYTSNTDLVALKQATLSYKLAATDAWTALPVATVKVSSAVNGVVTITASGPFTAVANYFLLTISYAYKNVNSNPLGYTTMLDQFSNDSTQASKLATVHFVPGIYATDAYNPYVAYNPGDLLYVMTGGYLTTAIGTGATAAVIGKVIKAPQTNFTAEQQTVNNHLGSPELLTVWLNL
jgi:hypothetical protein